MSMMWRSSLRGVVQAAVRSLLFLGFFAVLLGSIGCNRPIAEAGSDAPPVVPMVKTARPERMTFHRVIEQPARVEAFEETPIYAKIPGYVQEVRVEVAGTRVRKDELL